jgi:peptidylprolyl isomerase
MKKSIIILLVAVVAGIGIWQYTKNIAEPKTTTETDAYGTTTEEPKDQPITTNTNPSKKTMTAVLHTNKGDITIEFSTNTPKTVENFVTLAKSGFYDNTKFHRVIKGFMSQGGDPLSKDDSKKALWGTGGPGYKFDDELTPENSNDTYTIAMANAGPNTNGSQFFINAAPNHFLDTKHVVFGRVTVGKEVADAINAVPTDGSDKPIDPVIIKSVTVQ